MRYYHITYTFDNETYHGLSVFAPNIQVAYMGMYNQMLMLGCEWWDIKHKVWVSTFSAIQNNRSN